MTLLKLSGLQKLPRWATVAFLARCARRLLPAYRDDAHEPAQQRLAVAQAVELAEKRASVGGADEPLSEPLMLGQQYFDEYDVDSLMAALYGAVEAASNTRDDCGEVADYNLAATSVARDVFRIAFGDNVARGDFDRLELSEAVIDSLLRVSQAADTDLQRDLDTVASLATASQWTDETPVASDIFGAMWPNGLPEGWPLAELSFRPRARIIRTIGDRLISGPEAAVIELIKNSHDADASWVRVSYVPPIRAGEGLLIVEDDGHGMSLEDIERKWMEPATTDKGERRASPKGRRFLGSKGIGRFASARLGRYLELKSTAQIGVLAQNTPQLQTSLIPQLDWNQFEEGRYLEDVRFRVQLLKPELFTGTVLKVSSLRDTWTEGQMLKLYHELRRLVSPIEDPTKTPFKIHLDLSACTIESCGFDGAALVRNNAPDHGHGTVANGDPFLIRPFPVLEASDYSVDGLFNEEGTFEGTMTIRRGGQEPESILMQTPLHAEQGETPCGIVLVKLQIFDREAEAVRATAERAGLGTISVREARKLLDRVSGVAIYRDDFRVRPYGDEGNDWLKLDTRRVQDPSRRIGHNQIAGIVSIESEQISNLVERSSREGLEENGSFQRLNALVSTLLAEVVEPRRRLFRESAGLEKKNEADFQDIYRQVKLGWSRMLLAKIPEQERDEAQALITRESDRLTDYLRQLEEKQVKLQAQVTMGQIVGEVMHQGNTPLSFIETEAGRLKRRIPGFFDTTAEAERHRQEYPAIVNGLDASASKLRALFNALSPLSGARRGEPRPFDAVELIASTRFLFESRLQKLGIECSISPIASARKLFGYRDDLANAVTNLLDNAIFWLDHHRIADPKIQISFEDTGEQCRIKIADNGKGVPTEFAERVFGVGFTLKPHGTGLGLSIAKDAIQRSGGSLELLASATGAAFQISFPLEPAA